MIMRSDARIRFVGLPLVALLVVAFTACADDDDHVDLGAVEITVGSRDFAEQHLLSEILIQSLERAGAQVTDAVDTGDLTETRDALLSGDIDAYWEYNSAVWVDAMGNDPGAARDGEETTERVRETDAENGIRWIGRSSFNNTYGFAASPDLAAEQRTSRYSVNAFGLEEMADLVAEESDIVVCVEPEFAERADGLALFERETGTTIPTAQLRVLGAIDEIYPAVAEGECDIGEVFTTSGQLEQFPLRVIEDRDVFLPYQASLTIRDEVYRQAPEDFDVLVDRILSALSSTRIRELNGRVAGGESISNVADDFVDEFVDDRRR